MSEINISKVDYSIFDKPGNYLEISKKDYEVLIDNELVFNSPIEIIIPTFKRPTLLLEALNSAIKQEINLRYLITIIDNDPDSTNEMLLSKPEYKGKIRYIRNKDNLGGFGNWNRAIQVSRSPYIALLHDDDMLESNYLSNLIKVLDKFPEVGVVTHIPYQIKNGEIIDPFSNIKSKVKKNSLQLIKWKEYLFGNITFSSCMLINKDKAININGWCTQELSSGDWFFNARMAYNYNVITYHFPISKYRWDVNASLLPEVQIEVLFADANFINNNLIAENNLISPFNRLRIKINLYKRIMHTGGLVELTEFQKQKSMFWSIDELDRRKYLTWFYILFFRFYNKIDRIVLWLVNHQRI